MNTSSNNTRLLWASESDGQTLSCYTCQGQEILTVDDQDRPPVGAVIIVHGLGEHPGRHLCFARKLAKQGLRCICFALGGHGFPQGESGGQACKLNQAYFGIHQPRELSDLLSALNRESICFQQQSKENQKQLTSISAAEHTDHLIRVAAQVAAESELALDLPLFLAGHSLGGLICAALGTHHKKTSIPNMRGLVLLSPALAPHGRKERTLEIWLTRQIWFGRKGCFAPIWNTINSLAAQCNWSTSTHWTCRHVSDLAEETKLYELDPLIHKRIPISYLISIANLMDKVERFEGPWDWDTLMLIPGKDAIVNIQGAINFAAKFNRVDLRQYRGVDAHELIRSSAGNTVTADVGEWIRRRL